MSESVRAGAAKIVALGGRSGPSLIVQGFRGTGWEVTALVATTDTGSSSGVIRDQFGLPAPGDIRTVLATAADQGGELGSLTSLFEFRFAPRGDSTLQNMALGNLILTALAQELGDFDRAVEAAGRLLNCGATVRPVPSSPATLCARLADGSVVRGEEKVRGTGKPPIAELFLDPVEVQVPAATLGAILEADLVVLGPGGLFCSVLPCLLPHPIRQAIGQRRGKTVYVCNSTTQPGQTDGFDVVGHVQEILRYLGEGQLDYVLLNIQVPAADVVAAYRADEVHFMAVAAEEIQRVKALGPIPIVGDFVEADWRGKRSLHKLDTIRHDPQKLAASLQTLLLDGGRGHV